ncbi:MAG: hypothetical protein RL497_209 [Pseudomonadota bacterium]|jgi:hypothetical protein
MKYYTIILVFVAALLTACGGETPKLSNNITPTVTITAPLELAAGTALLLSANAKDADGSIASYKWSIEGDATLAFGDPSKAQLTFILPDYVSDTILTATVVVTDDKGATAKTTHKIAVISKKYTVTLQGFVVLIDAIPYANIHFAIGDLSFDTKADAQGEYRYQIKVDNAHAGIPIRITARAADAHSPVELASIINSVQSLAKLADDNGVITGKNYKNLNINVVTTAEYAEMGRTTYYGTTIPISTDDQLAGVQSEVIFWQSLDLAAGLQIIATDTRFPLPHEFKTMLDFVQNEDKYEDFNAYIKNQDKELFEHTKKMIFNDLSPWDHVPNPSGTYVLVGYRKTFIFKFGSEFQGEITGADFAAPFQWAIDYSDYASPIISLTFTSPIKNERGAEVIIKNAKLSYSLSRGFDNNIKISRLTYSDGFGVNEISGSLYDTSKALTPNPEIIYGVWDGHSLFGAARYNFSAGGAVEISPYRAAPGNNYSATWSLQDTALTVISEKFKENLYLFRDLGVGYRFVNIAYDLDSSQRTVIIGNLVRQQENLALTQNDVTGIWRRDNGELQVVSENGFVFDDLARLGNAWSLNEGQNFWSQAFYLTPGQWLTSCNYGGGEIDGCELYMSFKHKLLAATKDRRFYLKEEIRGGFLPDYSVVSFTRLPKIERFGFMWLTSSIGTFYRTTAAETKVWEFYQGKLIVGDTAYEHGVTGGVSIKYSLKEDKLHYIREGKPLELQLIEATTQGLVVCEYAEGGRCNPGTEFFLSNRSPVSIGLKAVGAGRIVPDKLMNGPDFYFGNIGYYQVLPDAGSTITSVTGCDGSLNGTLYTTTAVRESCTITAKFEKLPISGIEPN